MGKTTLAPTAASGTPEASSGDEERAGVVHLGQPSDAELVERAREGDRWARAALYHRHAPHVSSLALRLLRDRDTADDVLQDTFVSAFETMHQLRTPSKVRAWLRQIAVRHVQRRFRRRKLRRLLGFRPRPSVPLAELASQDAPQEAVVQLERVDEALRATPERARLVWTLRQVEGETLPAIAAACGISLATVKRDLTRAQDAVRAVVDDETEGTR
ncbi:MAG TPA: RNA polymerase sigma factor [Sandaracinaceae bacterium LLY-WYZ-13_1]|nr:RNA polymerase sigma factor [Sandaracinaceae bacterium LLY-WYZ-13_1]